MECPDIHLYEEGRKERLHWKGTTEHQSQHQEAKTVEQDGEEEDEVPNTEK